MSNKFFACAFVLTGLVLVMTGFKTEPASLTGVWIRKEDGLVIEVKELTESTFVARIVQEGAEKFPCEVSDQPIYKNITKRKSDWECDFLVVEINRCKSDYEKGSIRITRKGEMEVNCEGFGKKYYTKRLPRYYRNDEKVSL